MSTENETVARWMADRDEEDRARNAYRDVVRDLIAAPREMAFTKFTEEQQDAFFEIIEASIRLAHNCTKDFTGAPGIRKALERRFFAAIRDAIDIHQLVRK